MKIGFICKYPPIVGGVASKAYWLTRALADKGIEVHVITNAFEVESKYREELDGDDLVELQNRGIKLHASFPGSTPAYIPQGNPFEIKLASITLDLIESHGLDILDCWYFVPNGVAGYMVNSTTNIPWVVRHAGSDIGRIFPNHLFAPFLKVMLNKATRVVTNRTHIKPFEEIGIDSSRLWVNSLVAVNPDYFNPNGALAGCVPTDKPIILNIGKLGLTKGTFDLLKAFVPIKDSAYLLYLTGGPRLDILQQEIKLLGLQDHVIIHPPVPPWRVPEFIRASCCVIHAERDFQIVRHTPILPREVFACGKCFLVSEEIYKKYNYFRAEENVLVTNPHNHKDFTRQLRKIIDNQSLAEKIGAGALKTSGQIEDFSGYVDENIRMYQALIK